MKMADLRGISRRGIAVTLILLACCALCAPAQAGVSPEVGRAIYPYDNDFIVGEKNLSFFDAAEFLISEGWILSNRETDNIVIRFNGPFDSSRYADALVPEPYTLAYIVFDEFDKPVMESYTILIISPNLKVTPIVNEVEGFDWVTKGMEISFRVDTELQVIKGPLPNNITYKLVDNRNVQLKEINGVSLTNIDVSGSNVDYLTINTTGMRTGEYRLSIETDPETNNGLDIEGDVTSFAVRSKGITIEPDVEKQTVSEEVVFTISTTPNTIFQLDVTWGLPSNMRVLGLPPPVVSESDKDGIISVNTIFTEAGSYEITATEAMMGTTDSVFVTIVPYEAKLTVNKDPPIYHIGEKVEIDVSATAGDSITLAIEDEVVDAGLDVDGDDYSWGTENLAPDSYKISMWVLPFSEPEFDPPDESLTIMLLRGGLFAEPSAPFVAFGDKFTIEGTVPGRDRVEIFTIAPDGGGGQGLDRSDIWEDTDFKLEAPGLTYETTGVDTDGEFETEEIGVSKDADTGTYLIAALNYGRDGIWGMSQSDDLLAVLSNDYATALGVKTTDQLLAILKDKTINAAGSDDLLGIATISVEQGFVTVDELEDVPLGGDLKVTGTTNRQVDTAIIVTVESLEVDGTKLKPQIATAKEDDKIFYNSFDITFDTESANIGTYQVTAEDGDGHTASTAVHILPAEEHSVNVSTTPSPKPAVNEPVPPEPIATPSPTMTPVPSSPSPATESAKEPGYETLPALMALAVLSILLVRSRQKR